MFFKPPWTKISPIVNVKFSSEDIVKLRRKSLSLSRAKHEQSSIFFLEWKHLTPINRKLLFVKID